MPIYEYRCTACGTRYESLVSRTDSAPRCPQCGDANVERLLSAFAVTKARSAAEPGPCGSPHCACRPSTAAGEA